MASLTMPTFQDGKYHISYGIDLEGVSYYVYLNFNEREEKWYLSIHDATNEPIEGCVCRKLVTNWQTLIGATVDGRPPGNIYTSSVDHIDPDLLELGTRVALSYIEAD